MSDSVERADVREKLGPRFAKPDPGDPVTAPHYEALREHRILIQKCADCGLKRWLPTPVCRRCWSMNSLWTEISRDGVVHSWTRIHQAFWPATRDEVPYQVAIVEMLEGVRLLGTIPMSFRDQLETGLEVRAQFLDMTDGLTLLYFTPSTDTERLALREKKD